MKEKYKKYWKWFFYIICGLVMAYFLFSSEDFTSTGGDILGILVLIWIILEVGKWVRKKIKK